MEGEKIIKPHVVKDRDHAEDMYILCVTYLVFLNSNSVCRMYKPLVRIDSTLSALNI